MTLCGLCAEVLAKWIALSELMSYFLNRFLFVIIKSYFSVLWGNAKYLVGAWSGTEDKKFFFYSLFKFQGSDVTIRECFVIP
jgi:hypothetical protein